MSHLAFTAARQTVTETRGTHVPSTLAPFFLVQAWQSLVTLPPHALSQQTPSTQ